MKSSSDVVDPIFEQEFHNEELNPIKLCSNGHAVSKLDLDREILAHEGLLKVKEIPCHSCQSKVDYSWCEDREWWVC